MAGPKKRLEAIRFVQKRCLHRYTSEAEIAEKNSRTTSYGEIGFCSVADAFTLVSNCYRILSFVVEKLCKIIR